MSNSPPVDQQHRDLALDTSHSCIVQAPAGSGKTELLTLRYLNLLALVTEPEEVLAITFTRKAASEMRNRITEAIAWANSLSDTEARNLSDPLEIKRFEIASKVLEQNHSREWEILANPSRLRIQTIDSFCLYLSRQLPIQSSLGGADNISTELQECFTDAARATLLELNGKGELADSVQQLLWFLDNDLNRVEKLLINLLGNRDQWFSYILDLKASLDDARNYLQSNLQELIDESVLDAVELLLPYEAQILELRNFSGSNLPGNEDFMGLSELPGSSAAGMTEWSQILNLLLTKSSEPKLRSSYNVTVGFPPPKQDDAEFGALCAQMKVKAKLLSESFSCPKNQELLEALHYLKLLPDPAYEAEQWQLLSALTQVLSNLSQQLLLAFRNRRLIDHTQAGAAASIALGAADSPTELALAMDHKISHILVDEFQDTSGLQLDLLKQLTEGWQQNDGKTLFVVGDAMQSCYGFRNANVGIYLDVREHGIGDIKLTPLTLQSNFRSQAYIVEWVNDVFQSAFPATANISRGAVPYSPASPTKKALDRSLKHSSVSTDLIFHDRECSSDAKLLEAEKLVETILSIREEENKEPEQKPSSIAILIRSRSHLQEITPALREAGIQWMSTEIDPLSCLPVIEDLLSLLRAVLNLTDRIAWHSILRAPWCGLSLDDLLSIQIYAEQAELPLSVYSALQELDQIEGLSSDARQRLTGFMQVVNYAISMRFHISLSTLLEQLWTMLRGPDLINSPEESSSIDLVFQQLEQQQVGYSLTRVNEFIEKVSKSFVPAADSTDSEGGNTIQILTMHKAKGLEFDHVIIPGLNRKPVSDRKELINWHERLNHRGEKKLFIGAISPTGKDDDPLYSLIRHEKSHKSLLEDTRLLYIAITRAVKSVHLLATVAVKIDKDENREPSLESKGLLKRIWPELQQSSLVQQSHLTVDNMENANAHKNEVEGANKSVPANQARRFTDSLQLSDQSLAEMGERLEDLNGPNASGPDDSHANDNTATSENPMAAMIGTLIHEALQTHVQQPLNEELIASLRTHWLARLDKISESEEECEQALLQIRTGLDNCLADEENNWIFDSGLQDSACELEVQRQTPFYAEKFIIDRTFIDPHGVRWIIDYKTAVNPGNEERDFIEQQRQRYKPQLDNYRELFSAMEDRTIKPALYLSSIPALVLID